MLPEFLPKFLTKLRTSLLSLAHREYIDTGPMHVAYTNLSGAFARNAIRISCIGDLPGKPFKTRRIQFKGKAPRRILGEAGMSVLVSTHFIPNSPYELPSSESDFSIMAPFEICKDRDIDSGMYKL